MESYVTYNESGALTGAFQQSPPAEHVARIAVDSATLAHWPMFRANANRDGIELSPVVAPMPTVAQYTAAIQEMMDEKAQEKRYDNILSACTYVTSTVPAFQAEGQACVEWRDAVWAQSYSLMEQVQGGTLPQPTIAELLAMLPEMEWPE